MYKMITGLIQVSFTKVSLRLIKIVKKTRRNFLQNLII
jgi:hypothetical protein